MRLAIVGTTHNMTENEERDVRQTIALLLKDYIPIETTIISGGAKGVDTIPQEIGLLSGFAVKPLIPIGFGWDANKTRNLQIANECHELICISIPYYKNSDRKKCYHHPYLADHQKTAGCWTLMMAKQAGKHCQLIVTPKR